MVLTDNDYRFLRSLRISRDVNLRASPAEPGLMRLVARAAGEGRRVVIIDRWGHDVVKSPTGRLLR